MAVLTESGRLKSTWISLSKLFLFVIVDLTLRSFVCVSSATSSPQGSYDFRIIPYEDLLDDRETFVYPSQSHNFSDFSTFVFDMQRLQIVVGARDHLLRLSMNDLSQKEVVPWTPDARTRILCNAKGKPKSECHNFIRVLHIRPGRLYACGTYAHAPKCSWRSINQLSRVYGREEPGVAKCPFSPNQNATSLMTEDGLFFSGTVTDFNSRDYTMYRIMGEQKPLRTPQYNSQWLNSPQFISSYEINNVVYFFFREPAIEYINCGKKIYSRVARVCKNDPGGQFALLEDNWTTFMKARLNCSIPGEYPFYFDELQSTHLVKEEGLLYAVFTTPVNSIQGSAVCIFNMTAVHNAFQGDVRYQATSRMAWERHNNPLSSHRCPNSPGNPSQRSAAENVSAFQQQLSDAAKYQLADQAVQPNVTQPLANAENERWSHIAVDIVDSGNGPTYHVVFVATSNGVVKKFVRLPGHQQACFVEEITVFPAGQENSIRNIKLMEGYLFVGTNDKLIKLPVHRCGRFPKRRSCLNAMDPYCGWHAGRQKCMNHNSNTEQDMSSCPVTEFRMDGAWSDWDAWQSCDHVTVAGEVTQCKCRTRKCDRPEPMMGGRPCRGSATEVKNCTINGQWAAWSSWSTCSQSCGQNAYRHRTRECSGPAPQFGGRLCEGHRNPGARRQSERCTEKPTCPMPPVDGEWSGWSEWSQCTKHCGEGTRQRQRRCDNPSPSQGGRGCAGNEQEWNSCNTHMCPEKRRSSQWTPWMKANGTRSDGSFTEVRYKFMCKARVPHERNIQSGSMKMEKRACTRDGQDCSTNGDGSGRIRNVNGGWSYWSEWTPCDKQCGGGAQWRERRCDSPEPMGSGNECMGYPIEQRECNVHSCQGQWSCWGEWSLCSVSCGSGQKWRRRSCQSTIKGRTYNLPCVGHERETAPCRIDNCEISAGWDDWSEWSACGDNHHQFRKRVCGLTNPSEDECAGSLIDERPCLYNEGEIKLGKVQQIGGGGIGIEHAIGGAIAGFVVGALLVFGIFMFIRRKERNAKPEQENELNHKNEAQPNLYISTLPSVPSGISLNNYCSEQSLNAMNTALNTSTLNRTINRKESKKDNLKENAKRNSMRTNLSLNDL